MEATLGLTLACLNLKKYNKMMARLVFLFWSKIGKNSPNETEQRKRKDKLAIRPVCLHPIYKDIGWKRMNYNSHREAVR